MSKGFFEYNAGLKIPSAGRLTEVMSRLYTELDVIPPPTTLSGYPTALEELVEQVYHKGHNIGLVNFFEGVEPTPEMIPNRCDDKVVVGFSGGKDSLAAALVCRKRGLQPTLFYVKGVNRSYPGEFSAAVECSVQAGLYLTTHEVSGFGKSSYKENPVKDQLILAMMVDYGSKRGTTKYTMGLHTSEVQKESNILYNWSDSVEMMAAGNAWIKSEIPEFEFFWCVKNHSQSLSIICEENFDLLQYTTSCLTPHRFQKMRREETEKKYGVELLKNRCGVCWKCCCEWMNLFALTKVKPDDFYLKRCFDKFKQDLDVAYCRGYSAGKTDLDIWKLAVDPEFIPHSLEAANFLGIS